MSFKVIRIDLYEAGSIKRQRDIPRNPEKESGKKKHLQNNKRSQWIEKRNPLAGVDRRGEGCVF